jgi:hypothetical protein
VRAELARVAAAGSKKPSAGPASDELRADLEAIRAEIALLKRRIAVRSKTSMLDDEQIEELAERISAAVRPTLTSRELDRIASTVVNLLTESLEVVPDEPAPKQRAAAPKSRQRSR